MKDVEIKLLIELARRELVIAARTSPTGYGYAKAKMKHAEEMRHGPRWENWFGVATPPQRMAYMRAWRRLEADGLVALTLHEGGRISNVRLTPAGREFIESLAASLEPSPCA